MKIPSRLAALALALAMGMSPVVLAQTTSDRNILRPVATVETFGVVQLTTLAPGSELAFTLNGTPGASVRLRIAGATDEVQMSEGRPGAYSGAYTVRSRDRLTAASVVTALVTKDGQTVSVAMDQSLVQGARSPSPRSLARISDFTVTARDRVRPGDELEFSMTGAPAGVARVKVQGVPTRIALTEVRRGVYEGRYTLRRGDRVKRDLDATAFLRVNKQETSQRFARGQDNDETQASRRERRTTDQNQNQNQVACVECGVVESIELVTIKGDKPNVLGTIAGGLLGGVLGNQVGGGSGKDLATIAGAVGGAYAGNRIENNMDKTQVHRVLVRLDSGAARSLDFASAPAVQVGARVRFDNDTIVVQ